MQMQNNAKCPGAPGRAVAGALAIAVVAMAGAAGAATAQQLTFTHIAGSAWTGDGGQAKAANLTGAADVVIDGAGNMYVSQPAANRIRKITPAGAITTIAGGNNGLGGDGGAASSALINRPTSMDVDSAGNLYFIDYGNRRVRRIGTDGKITTVAGNGAPIYFGDGGPAANASFVSPTGLAVDKNGNLYISDSGNARVRKVTAAGIISTYAGTGVQGHSGDNGPATSAQIGSSYDIDVDSVGNLFITDIAPTGGGSVRRIATNGTITTFHPDVWATEIHVDAAGNVYFDSDCTIIKRTGGTSVTYGNIGQNCGVRSPDGTPATSATFGYPVGPVTDAAGNLYFSDNDFAVISRISASDGKLTTYAGTRPAVADGTVATSALLSNVNHVAVGDDGSIVLSDYTAAYRVRRIVGGKVTTIGGSGQLASTCQPDVESCGSAFDWDIWARGLAAGPGGTTYVSNTYAFGVQRIAPDKQIFQCAGAGVGSVDGNPVTISARGIAMDAAGNLYIANGRAASSVVYKVDPAGTMTTFAGTGALEQTGDGGPAKSAGVNMPYLVAADAAGNVYVYENVGTIRKIARNGIIRRIAGTAGAYYSGEGGPALDAKLGTVVALAAHSTGVYFTSEGRLRRIRNDGVVESIINLPYYAQGVAIKNNYLYVSTSNGQIFRAPMPRKPAPADYNGDGRSDVLLRGSTGSNLVWYSADSTTRQGLATFPMENKLVGQGDFNGDGKDDLVWRNMITGANVLWRSGNATTPTLLATRPDTSWVVAGVGDFNGDGQADLFWHNTITGQNEYWRSGSSGAVRAVTTLVDTQWVLAGIGDFDGDGKSDLFWRHGVTGKNQVWSAAMSSALVPVASVTNVNWKVAAVGDFNGDGVSDVVWRDPTNGNTALWRSANTLTRQSIVAVTNTQWSIAAAGDYDNDGIDDLLWRNNVTGENTIWKNAANANQRVLSSAGNTWKILPYEAQP
jgi:hypothetical protein